jgi:hypothetical protein
MKGTHIIAMIILMMDKDLDNTTPLEVANGPDYIWKAVF